jgi:hypothetical protein
MGWKGVGRTSRDVNSERFYRRLMTQRAIQDTTSHYQLLICLLLFLLPFLCCTLSLCARNASSFLLFLCFVMVSWATYSFPRLSCY